MHRVVLMLRVNEWFVTQHILHFTSGASTSYTQHIINVHLDPARLDIYSFFTWHREYLKEQALNTTLYSFST